MTWTISPPKVLTRVRVNNEDENTQIPWSEFKKLEDARYRVEEKGGHWDDLESRYG